MNDLTLTSSSSFEDIAKIIGQDEPSNATPSMFYLKINRDHEDDSGRSIPAGSWTTSLDASNKAV